MDLVSISNSYCISLCDLYPCSLDQVCEHSMNVIDKCNYDNYNFGDSNGKRIRLDICYQYFERIQITLRIQETVKVGRVKEVHHREVDPGISQVAEHLVPSS